jgi:hypothetical protein
MPSQRAPLQDPWRRCCGYYRPRWRRELNFDTNNRSRPRKQLELTFLPRWAIFVVGIYAGAALLTLGFQTRVRLDQCSGIAPCAVSLAKGAIWSTIWPVSWPVYATGFNNTIWTRLSIVMGMLAVFGALVFVSDRGRRDNASS